MTTRFAGVGTMGQFGFFDADRRLAAITAKGDPLEMIARVVPFESFRAEIEAAVLTPVARSGRAKLRDHIESQEGDHRASYMSCRGAAAEAAKSRSS